MAPFHPSGVSKVVLAPSVASLTAPTRSEINAGTVLVQPAATDSEALREMTGWESADNPITVPNAANDFDSTIPGRKSASNPSISFYDDSTATTRRTACAEGTTGYVIIMPLGDVPTKRCQVWPIRVAALNDSPVNSAGEAKMFTVQFSVTGKPEKSAVIPAA